MLLNRPANAVTAESHFPYTKEKTGFSCPDPYRFAAVICEPTAVQLPARTERSSSYHYPYSFDKQIKHKLLTGKKNPATSFIKRYLDFIAWCNLYQPCLADLRRLNI
jgi:hypothetical protein